MTPPRVWNKHHPNIPHGSVYVGRPTKWGNPFIMSKEADRTHVVEQYKAWIQSQPELQRQAIRELRGRHLVCWCAPKPCHADVLLKIANEEPIE